MNCTTCNNPVNPGAKFCTNCGAAVPVYQTYSTPPAGNDVILLVSYIGWHYVIYLLYAFINEVVVKKLNENFEDVGRFYKITDWVVSGIDVIFILVVSLLLKNEIARIFCFVFLGLRIALIIYYQLVNN